MFLIETLFSYISPALKSEEIPKEIVPGFIIRI